MRDVLNFFKGDIRSSRCTTAGINDTSGNRGKIAAGVVDIAAGVVDTGGAP